MTTDEAGNSTDQAIDPSTGATHAEPAIEAFRVGERRSLAEWRRFWEADRTFPIESHRGWLGKPIVWVKKALRGLVRSPQADLWERQRAYNLRIQEQLEDDEARSAENRRALEAAAGGLEQAVAALGKDLQQIQSELVRDVRLAREAVESEHREIVDNLTAEIYQLRDNHLEFLDSHNERIGRVEEFQQDGLNEIMEHTAALYARVEQKLDRYRGLSRDRWSRLGALLQVAEEKGKPALAQAVEDEAYVEFEGLFRGREEDIGERLQPYLEVLSSRGEVLDLGCGRGEALDVFTAHGIECSGVDTNEEMVERCRAKGLKAEVSDLFSALEGRPEGSLGAVVSFHVIEHLPSESLERLVRLAWLALAPGGVLVLETPSPMSLVVGARNFWIDPTHRRPVHPESLQAIFKIAGFDPVERIDLQPFPADDRLPEIGRDGLSEDLYPLVDRINELRDQLDSLLYGYQDFGLVGHKPAD